MTITLEIPNSLFIETSVITGMNVNDSHVVIIGQPTKTILDFKNSEWQTSVFGFITSDVTELSTFEKIYHISKIIQFGKQHPNTEFLVNIYKDILTITHKEKAKSWV